MSSAVDRFMKQDFADQLRTASQWADRQLLQSGIKCPDLYTVAELIGTTYQPKREATPEESASYSRWIAMVHAAYALGFALGQKVPTFGKVQR